PVVRLDDLDIRLIAHDPSRHVQQLERQIDADAEVRRKDHRDLLGRPADQLLFLLGKAGGTDDHGLAGGAADFQIDQGTGRMGEIDQHIDRKSTRLNSSHVKISYAVFCWKKKKKNRNE